MEQQDDTPRPLDASDGDIDAPRPTDASEGEVDAPPLDASEGEVDARRPLGASDGEPPSGEADAVGDRPHDTRVVVWDKPAVVERGKRFAVRVGAACSSKCAPAGWRVEVRDHEGERRATATLGDDPWPGTDALHHAEVALVAPDVEGLHTWEAAASTEGLEVAHTGGRVRFGVRVVSAPACRLTVVAVDAESGRPVEGARVVAHPYRSVTDERGVAELEVPAGQYRLFVSGKGSIPFRFDGAVTTDRTIRAELAQDVELSDADIWS